MKRIVLYCLILALTVFLPVKGEDIEDLEPVQAFWIGKQNEKLVLQTDTGDVGVGDSVQTALQNMKESSAEMVYPDTAQYLFTSKETKSILGQFAPLLRSSVKVCIWEGGDVKEAVKYAQAHELGCKLRNWKPETELPQIPVINSQKSEE